LGDLVVTNEIDTVLSFLEGRSRIEIEIGSGNGHFLSAYGKRVRQGALLGIETKSKRCAKIDKKISAAGLSHILIFQGRAETVLGRLGPDRVNAFHVYFPDPWPKTKHRRRRLLRWPTLPVFHRTLKTGGFVFFGSDVFDYYLQAKVLFLHHGGFEIVPDAVPLEAVISLYSRKTRAAGKKFHALAARKQGGTGR
jgi:tRNA (guanine-N7-)-methyltransferase